ncbi:hypothetical protein Amet_0450 [Alkaliphilus metalliredigens QYMF]|uniref:Uncharacterized protein n=1 Tax=Alkaliphilus metalliredigens (strain QYMF) TaxID=293826 RepID=A6TKG0_ALKMQ|nr:hypothetical protein Amet_0450 [Alkaliphilus metalliredigens QYMF]
MASALFIMNDVPKSGNTGNEINHDTFWLSKTRGVFHCLTMISVFS